MKNLFYRIACTCLLCCISFPLLAAEKLYELASPDGRITLQLHMGGEDAHYTLRADDDVLLQDAVLDLILADDTHVASRAVVKSVRRQKVVENITPINYRQDKIEMEFNELSLVLRNGFTLQWRISDEGAAYRFICQRNGETIVKSETADFALGADRDVWLSYSTNDKKPMAMAFQNFYDNTPISKAQDKMAFLPATVKAGGHKMTLLESDVEAYPNLFVQADKKTCALKALHPGYPKAYAYYAGRVQQYVTETESYVAKLDGKCNLPWRVMAVNLDDTQMPVNNIVYALSSPSRIMDTSWIRGGKVAWDWWNDWNIRGVSFRAGINQKTYEYYVDFASSHGLEYVVLDEGWYVPRSGDMLTVVPEIDLPALVEYARQKGVKIILWTVFNVLDNQLQEACEKYSQMGVVGFKVDFLDRSDQTAVEMTYRIAEMCAKYHMTLDLHGFYTPTGLNRTWPNIVNFESVFGMEEMKWSEPTVDMPLYDVTFPFIRMMAGPVDFTPGAMRNATRKNWKAVYSEPMSMGTRAHEAAKYVVHDSPLTMLADAPSSYLADEAFTQYIASIPNNNITRTLIPQGEMGKFIVSVRETMQGYYVGGMTNWDERDVKLSFDFLPSGKSYRAVVLRDGVNADRNASDYVIEEMQVDATTVLPLHMASGGGFVVKVLR